MFRIITEKFGTPTVTPSIPSRRADRAHHLVRHPRDPPGERLDRLVLERKEGGIRQDRKDAEAKEETQDVLVLTEPHGEPIEGPPNAHYNN